MINKYLCYSFIALMCIVLFSNVSNAGGTSWLVSIEKFTKISDTSAMVDFQLDDDRRYVVNDCKKMTVFIDYEAAGRHTTRGRLVNTKKHQKALNYIALAYQSERDIRFGSIGNGLYPYNRFNNPRNIFEKLIYFFIEGKNIYIKNTCTFQSKGIALMEEDNGKQAVYSFE